MYITTHGKHNISHCSSKICNIIKRSAKLYKTTVHNTGQMCQLHSCHHQIQRSTTALAVCNVKQLSKDLLYTVYDCVVMNKHHSEKHQIVLS